MTSTSVDREDNRRRVGTLLSGAEKLVRVGDYETAIDTLEVALTLDAGSSRVREFLATLHEHLLERPPSVEIERLLTQAEAYLEQGQSGWAQAIAIQIYEIDPQNQAALSLLERVDSDSTQVPGDWEPPRSEEADTDQDHAPLLAKIDRLLSRPLRVPESEVVISTSQEEDSSPEEVSAPQQHETARITPAPEDLTAVTIAGRGSEEIVEPVKERSPGFELNDERIRKEPIATVLATPAVEVEKRRRLEWWLALPLAILLGATALRFWERPENLLSAGLSAVEKGHLYSRFGAAAIDYFDRLQDLDSEDAAALELGIAIAGAAEPELEATLRSFRLDADFEVDFARWHALYRIRSQIEPKDADAQFGEALTRAYLALEAEELPTALVALEDLEGRFPLQDFLVSNALGEAYGDPASANYDPARALRLHQQALRGVSGFIRPWLEIASLQEDSGEWQAAEDSLKRALEIDRDSPEVFRRLGFVLSRQRRWLEAKKAYRRSMLFETNEDKNRTVQRRLESLRE